MFHVSLQEVTRFLIFGNSFIGLQLETTSESTEFLDIKAALKLLDTFLHLFSHAFHLANHLLEAWMGAGIIFI